MSRTSASPVTASAGCCRCFGRRSKGQEALANLVTFTTPVDFSRNWPCSRPGPTRRFFDVDRLVETFGNCPGDYLYTAFDMLRPGTRADGRDQARSDQIEDEAYVKSTRMFERWAADILPLAGEYFREITVKMLMWDNRLLDREP